tara:strand:+ start:29885 stop:30265 length:381 start_codon:yes stop_codon:yes gene_type:complete
MQVRTLLGSSHPLIAWEQEACDKSQSRPKVPSVSPGCRNKPAMQIQRLIRPMEQETRLALTGKGNTTVESSGRSLRLFVKSFRLAEQLFVIRSSTALNTNVRRTADILLVDLEIGLQQLLHFAERF